ncbi:MFS transporter [Flindersiella endophytica]
MPQATARTWCGLGVLLLAALLTATDISVLFVAGPAIADALRPTATQWLWAMDIYSFLMAGLLITMGSLGDRIGRRKVLLAGAALFGVGSVVLAYAPTTTALILTRGVLAVGGATVAPSTLSLIRGMFADERERRAAVGAWTVAFAGGAVAGPILGGVLLERFWWGSVFLINVPVMALLLLTAPFLVPESKPTGQRGFDLPGAALSLAAILCVVFALKELARNGPTWPAVVAALPGCAAAAWFVRHERRTGDPLVDLRLFRARSFSVAVAVNAVIAIVTAGLGVLAFPYLQYVHHLTPLQSALWATPMLAGSFVGAVAATQLARRFSEAALLTSGLLLAATGLTIVASLATAQPDDGLGRFLLGYAILILGTGLTGTIAGGLVLSGVPSERAGAAAGIAETSAHLGSALGIAGFGTLAAAIYTARMLATAPPGTDPAALETIAGAQPAPALHESAFAAYADGVAATALGGAILTAALAGTTWFVLRRVRGPRSPAGSGRRPPGSGRPAPSAPTGRCRTADAPPA